MYAHMFTVRLVVGKYVFVRGQPEVGEAQHLYPNMRSCVRLHLNRSRAGARASSSVDGTHER
jgi:hypothetical protein